MFLHECGCGCVSPHVPRVPQSPKNNPSHLSSLMVIVFRGIFHYIDRQTSVCWWECWLEAQWSWMAFCSCWCLFFSPPLKAWLGLVLASTVPARLSVRNCSSEVKSLPMRILSSFKSEFPRLSKFVKSLRNRAWSEVWKKGIIIVVSRARQEPDIDHQTQPEIPSNPECRSLEDLI